MSVEVRRWKRAFAEDVEHPYEVPRKELTKKQKEWLIRSWTHMFGYVPNGIPIYNEREGFAHRPAIHVHWHHIVPIGEMNRLHGEGASSYNNPRNLAPICEANHTGRHAHDDDFVIHEDTRTANQIYHENKDAFFRMDDQRKILTSAGLIYHNDDYDMYLLDMADRVTSLYERDYPDDPFP